MKTKEVARFGLVLGAALLALGLAACGDDPVEEDTSDASTPLRVEQIIVNPKTGAAGDTLVMSADVRSSSSNVGDIPTLQWTATGGTFVEDDQFTVRWVAPPTSDVYVLTARATNAVGSASGETSVFVGGEVPILLRDAGAVTMMPGGVDFYYRRTANLTLGSDVYKYVGGVDSDATPPAAAIGFDVVFSPDLSFEAHWADTVYAGSVTATERPRHVYVGEFGSSSFRRISVDKSDPESPRRTQSTMPAISPNNHLVAYQCFQSNRYFATIDSMHVYSYDLIQNTRTKVTAQQRFPRNFFPTFSTDQRWLTFIADPTGASRWEVYGAPVSGDVVDADDADMVRLSSTSGTIASGFFPSIRMPLRAWNPETPDLAIQSRDGTLFIIQTNATGAATTEVVGLPGALLEMVWSPSGSQLAVSPIVPGFGGGIYIVEGDVASPLLTVQVGDAVRDLVWSPDGAWIVYSRSRGAARWFELVDVAAGEGVIPLAITGNSLVGDIARYRSAMSFSPAWGAGNQLFMPAFGVSAALTPGVISVNVSGAIQ